MGADVDIAGADSLENRERHRVTVTGVVQGVGFRPFVYALGRELALSGSVGNTSAGVVAEVEGAPAAIAAFLRRVGTDAPPLAVVESVASVPIPVRGGTEFVIEDSAAGRGRTMVSPDVATCAECRIDLNDPASRRHRNPFVTCTDCGPRFTIITGLPYDRPNTTMAGFPMCDACAVEYADPADRRFHAQPICCPDCGPRLRLLRPGVEPTWDDAALAEARHLLLGGAVVAVKGIGGYHLACDATDETAVQTLRKRKGRGDKPFAVMLDSRAAAEAVAHVDADSAALLTGPRRPIVLLPRRTDPPYPDALCIAEAVAPGTPDLGLFLPYTPLHHLLFGTPEDPPGPRALVMTSGNLAGEPIVTDDEQALARLGSLADAWLVHDRPIQVPCDDSVVRVLDGAELPVRRSRGYAPLPIALGFDSPAALATGGDLKNTFCLAEGRYAWLSAHVGDMDDLATLEAFETAERHLEMITGVRPVAIATDCHPAYRSRQWAHRHAGGRQVVEVQHHHAHIASAMAEHGHDGATPVIGVAFDGTGYGEDGAVWGGEFLVADYRQFQRVAHLRNVWLPGGDAGVRNPCRMALSHLIAAGVAWNPLLPSVAACSVEELAILARQLESGFGCAPTSSMGRLFDAIASIAGVCQRVDYEAQAAIELEGAARGRTCADGTAYAFGFRPTPDGVDPDTAPVELDAGPVIAAAARDNLAGVDGTVIGARFHRGVIDLVAAVCRQVREATGIETVALSGGVFDNTILSSGCASALNRDGFTVLRHHRVPPTDAGIALGQLAVLAHVARPGSGSDRYPSRLIGAAVTSFGEETPCA
ncbi:MAG: carbamoyltransferase HypF [Geodermatophilaceae bacterium]|nr:carbamoyltransferase HypF [Geodermatophilaceae bacterium]